MSHNNRNKEIQMVEEKTTRRRHSHHGHLHLKPVSVIDHLKTKVKRKRSSKLDSANLSDGTLNQNINNNNNNNNNKKLLTQDRAEFIPAISTDSRSITSSSTSRNKPSFGINDIEINNRNHEIIEKDEEDSVVPNVINEDDDIEGTVQWRTNPITSDVNQRMSKSKLKLIKATKSLSDTTNQLNTKKRRKIVRRTGFQVRDEDFSVIFNDLPSDEQLVISYPCAWRKDVFMHGRMFLTVNYLCFYTCFFKWEESLCISYKDIISVTREKSVKVLPNAIKLRTKNQEQYIFASHLPREKIFVSIFRLWQNALLEQPLDYQQLRALVFADQLSHDESSGDSEESLNLDNTGEDPPPESILYTQSLPVTSDRSKESLTGVNRRVVSLQPPTDNETTTYLSSCTCENHLAKTYADRLFTFNVDTLFELLFGDNSFTKNFHTSQKLTDYAYGEWRLNKETGQRERQVTYKAIAQSVIGTNSLSCREKQILEVEKANLIYVLSSEVYNEGMKYTDSFYVATRFCMTQRDAEHSSLRVTAEIRYIKNVNSLIKTFIEKNAYSSIEDGVNEQVRRLENQQVTQVNSKSTKKRISVLKQRPRESINNKSQKQIQDNPIILPQSKVPITEKTITGKGVFYDIALFIGIFLLLVHIYLCYKLYSFDQSILTPDTICLNQCKKTCLENNVRR